MQSNFDIYIEFALIWYSYTSSNDTFADLLSVPESILLVQSYSRNFDWLQEELNTKHWPSRKVYIPSSLNVYWGCVLMACCTYSCKMQTFDLPLGFMMNSGNMKTDNSNLPRWHKNWFFFYVWKNHYNWWWTCQLCVVEPSFFPNYMKSLGSENMTHM